MHVKGSNVVQAESNVSAVITLGLCPTELAGDNLETMT